MSDFPEVDRAVAALTAICPEHTVAGIVVRDDDCGACGSRQDAAALYLVTLVDDVIKALKL